MPTPNHISNPHPTLQGRETDITRPNQPNAPTHQTQEHNLPHPNHPSPAGSDRDAALTHPNQDNDLTCEICGFRMLSRQCKIRCPNCGFTRDCSDP